MRDTIEFCRLQPSEDHKNYKTIVDNQRAYRIELMKQMIKIDPNLIKRKPLDRTEEIVQLAHKLGLFKDGTLIDITPEEIEVDD